MVYRSYGNVNLFYSAVSDMLHADEVENIIQLGNLYIGIEGTVRSGWRDTAKWLMATVSGASGPLLSALMTPPHNLTLFVSDKTGCESSLGTTIEDAAVDCLVKGLLQDRVAVPGVMARAALAERFAVSYSKATGIEYSLYKSQCIYELSAVSDSIIYAGTLRLAEKRDLSFYPYWLEGFNCECFGRPLAVADEPSSYEFDVNSGRLFIYEVKGIPVSMARLTRQTKRVCCVGGVYTPPYFRRRGYATESVAAVSRAALKLGFDKCALYTDLANQVANSIYPKIGYRAVKDSADIRFAL